MPCNLYGINDNYHPYHSHVLAAMIRRFDDAKNKNLNSVKCWGSGQPRREFLYVDDLASSVLHCLEHWHPSKDELSWINVGASTDISIEALAGMVARASGYTGLIDGTNQPDGVYSKLMDSSKYMNLVGSLVIA